MGRLVLALLVLCASAPAPARTFTVDDLLSMESYGQAAFVPDAGLLLVERRRPYGEAPDFGYGGYFTDRVLGRIMAVPIGQPSRGLRPLFVQEESAGYWMGSLSPSGRRLSVFRLKHRVLSLGVVDVRRGTVVWMDVRPDLPARDPAPVWLDERRLLVSEVPSGGLPRLLRLGSAGAVRLTELQGGQARGRPSWTKASTIGSPAFSGRLVVIDVDRLRRRIIFDRDVRDFAVSPDRRTVAVVSAGSAVRPPSGPIGVSFVALRRRVSMVSIAEGTIRHGPGDVAPNVLVWSRAGLLLVVARDLADSDWTRARYVAVSASGRATTLGGPSDDAYVLEPADTLRFQATWAGAWLAARVRGGQSGAEWRMLAPGRSAPVRVPGAAVPEVHDGLQVVLRAGAARWIVGDGRTRRLAARVRPIAMAVLDPFSAGDRGSAGPCGRIVLAGVAGAAARTGCAGGAVPGPGEDVLAGGASRLAVRKVDDHGVETLAMLGPDGSRVVIDRVNAGMSAIDLPTAIRLESVDDAGARLSHWLLLPARSSGRIPMVVQPYPGRAFSGSLPIDARPWRYGFAMNALLLVDAGLAVLLPSMPRSATGNPVERVLPQVEAAVEAARRTGLVATDGYGVMGHSFGGWAAMVLAGRDRCVTGVVAANGSYDLAAAHGALAGPDRIDMEEGVPLGSGAGWAEAGQGGLWAKPSEVPERYAAASPILGAPRVSMPVLLVGGDLDPVDLTQTEHMFMELARNGADASLMRFWGEGHTVGGSGNLRAYWSAVTSFLKDHARPRAGGVPCHAAQASAESTSAVRPMP